MVPDAGDLVNGWRKSSYSNPSGCCLETAFRKSSYSGGTNCTEAALAADLVLVRDSKLGEASPILAFSPAQWQAFTSGIKGS